MSWAPFVGTFIARISRGRTIRQFVVCVLLVPTLVSSVWFSILGGAAVHAELGGDDLATANAEGPEKALFALLDLFPLTAVSATLVVLLITFFFVSSADSASVVLGMLSSKGNIDPHKGVVVLWGSMIGATAIVLLLADGLSAIQSAAIVIAVPFLLLMVVLCVQLVRELRTEPVVSTVPEGVYTAMYEEMDDRETGSPGPSASRQSGPGRTADDRTGPA
jgi:choline-glycine betaine transporter